MSAIIDYLYEKFGTKHSYLWVHVSDTPFKDSNKTRVNPLTKDVTLPPDVLSHIENIVRLNYPDVDLLIAGYMHGRGVDTWEAQYFLKDNIKRGEIENKRMAIAESVLLNPKKEDAEDVKRFNIFYEERDNSIVINGPLTKNGICILSKLEDAFSLRKDKDK